MLSVMASKDPGKPYKGRPSRKKQKSKTSQMEAEVSPDNETNVESESNNLQDTPSRQEFQQLSKTVTELTDLIKSLKGDITSNNNSSISQNVSGVTHSDKTIPVDGNTNETLMANSNQLIENDSENAGIENRDMACGSQLQNEPTPLNLNQINDSIATHLSNLMGEDDTFTKPGNYTPTDQPVDLKVSDKVRNMIWSNQYIDLGVLLDPSLEYNKPKYEFVGQSGEPVTIAPKKAARSITGLGQWCSAFTVFINIYCQKYPNELPMLFTYMNTIKKLAHRNGLYLTYDEEFRYMRQSQHLAWNITHSGLWLECRDNPNQSKNQKGGKPKTQGGFRNNAFDNGGFRNNPFENGGRKQNHPTGYCFRYHSYGKCGRPTCNFIHRCYNQSCKDEQHPIFKCPNMGKNKEQNVQNTQAKSATVGKSK